MSIGQWSHEDFIAQVLKFHGHAAPGVIIGGYMVEKARRALPEGISFRRRFRNRSMPARRRADAHALYRGQRLAAHLQFRHLRAFCSTTSTRARACRVRLDVDKLGRWPHTRIWLLKEKPKPSRSRSCCARKWPKRPWTCSV